MSIRDQFQEENNIFKIDEEDFRRIRSHVKNEIELEKKYVPEHPYCTNWPMTKKKYEQLEFDFKEDQVAPI